MPDRQDQMTGAAASELHSPTHDLPLLFLDVDGVINDLRAHRMLGMFGPDSVGAAEQLGVTVVRSHGFMLAVPDYMPELIRELASRSETWWCTTWRDWANDELATHLGVGPFQVIDAKGTDRFSNEWKSEAVRAQTEQALSEGRSVVWIEDFNGDLPDLDGVIFVDTGERGVLTWADLPLGVFD